MKRKRRVTMPKKAGDASVGSLRSCLPKGLTICVTSACCTGGDNGANAAFMYSR